jgi:hypothetical protein
MHKAAPQIAER